MLLCTSKVTYMRIESMCWLERAFLLQEQVVDTDEVVQFFSFFFFIMIATSPEGGKFKVGGERALWF